jgi:hypothetical protein
MGSVDAAMLREYNALASKDVCNVKSVIEE